MARPVYPESRLAFQRFFQNEEACLKYLIESRWPNGFLCPHCGFDAYYWKGPRRLFQCKRCGVQTSVTAGTVMHRSKIPLWMWFQAAWLVTTVTPGMSAVQFARQMGIGSYKTAFHMLHKLRAAMVKEGRELLHGAIEADETYVGGPKPGPGGRGALGKVVVAGAVEVRGEYAGRVRLRVVKDVSGESLIEFVKANVAPGSTIHTDDWVSYGRLPKAGYKHIPKIEGKHVHIHRVFSNLKTWLLGTHHGVSPQHLQAYLNEFAFRFNRRKTPMAAFQTVLGLIAERHGPTYEELYGIAKGKSRYHHPNPIRRGVGR